MGIFDIIHAINGFIVMVQDSNEPQTLLHLDSAAFKQQYSMPVVDRMYCSRDNVFFLSNEFINADAMALNSSGTFERKGNISISVIGGVDIALSLHVLKEPQMHIMVDVNPFALQYLEFRLDLMKQCDSPAEYINKLLCFQGFDINEFQRVPNLEEFEKLTGTLRYSFSFETLDAVVHDDGLKLILLESRGIIEREQRPIFTITPGNTIYYMITQALFNPNFWLYIKDSTTFEKVKRDYINGIFKPAHMDILEIVDSNLGKTLSNGKQFVDFIYLSNIPGAEDFMRYFDLNDLTKGNTISYAYADPFGPVLIEGEYNSHRQSQEA